MKSMSLDDFSEALISNETEVLNQQDPWNRENLSKDTKVEASQLIAEHYVKRK